MSNPRREPLVHVDDYCRIVKGVNIPVHGKVDYGMFTNKGQGYLFGEDGRHVLVCDSTSYESVGNEISENNPGGTPGFGGNNSTFFAKWINAKNGDIKIEAPNGTIHLEARNIRIKAVGAESSNESDGSVLIKASNEIELNSRDQIKLNAPKISLTSSLSLDFNATFLNTVAQFATTGSSIDAAVGTLTAASKPMDAFFGLSNGTKLIADAASQAFKAIPKESLPTGTYAKPDGVPPPGGLHEELPNQISTEQLQVGQSNAETLDLAAQERELNSLFGSSNEAQTLLDGGTVDGTTFTLE